MVKGVSRQVIVVHSPEPELFEQAIFILKDEAVGREGVTDEALLKEAKRLISNPARKKKPFLWAGPVWAVGGALVMGAIWLLTVLI